MVPSLVRGSCPSALLVLVACTGSPCDPVTPAPVTPAPPANAPAAPKGPVFVVAPGWDGPAVNATRAAADAALVVRLAAPTPGYRFTLDAVLVKDGAREVQVTLLQPPADVLLPQVISELELGVDAAKLAGPEPLAVAVRRMQDGAHYLVPPPWLRAVVQQP